VVDNSLEIKYLSLDEDNYIVLYYLIDDDDENKLNPFKYIHYIATHQALFYYISIIPMFFYWHFKFD
jgi:hypothetical protein